MFRVGQKVWKDISWYEGRYRVSNHGDVFSVLSDIVLTGSPSSNKYLTIALHKDGRQETKLVHRLVAEAFIDNPQGKPSVNHIDSVRANNHADNLEWCTPMENTRHGMLHGRIAGVPKVLTDMQAAEIRDRYKRKHRMIDLAHEYEVSHSTIKNVIRGNYYSLENTP